MHRWKTIGMTKKNINISVLATMEHNNITNYRQKKANLDK